MNGYIYFTRNGSLHNIGFTKNLEKRLQELQPDEVLATLKIESYEQSAKELQMLYSKSRLPLSDYFRLTKKQVTDCKNRLINAGAEGESLTLTGWKLIITFILVWLGISGAIIKFGIQPIFEGLGLNGSL